MNPVLLGIFILGVLVTMALPLLLAGNAAWKKQFEEGDGRKLIEVNMHAGMMKGRLRLAAYLMPLPIIILVRCFPVQNSQTLVIGAAFVVIFACLSGAQVFGVIEKLTADEMEKRNAPPDVKQ